MLIKTFVLGMSLFAATVPSLSSAALAQIVPPNPGIVDQKTGDYTVTIGDVRVTSLSDGTVPQDVHTLLHGTPVAARRALKFL